jgi:antibiotic biosynthesis monooxygenase (ABM) superfamily enzyme
MKKLLLPLLVIATLAVGPARAAEKASVTAPKSVIHVITVDFKDDATPAQIQAAIDGIQRLPSAYPGVTRVWTRAIKNQSGKSHVFVMEFADEKALADYTDSKAQKAWYETYLPIRKQSATSDITN